MESVSHRRIAVLFVQLACLLLGASVKPGASNSAPDMYLCSNLNTSYVTLPGNACSNTASFIIYILEEVPIGVPLIQFEARDPENDNVAMTLVGKDQSIYFFSVVSYPNNRTAVLKQNSRLDADSLNKISLVLQIKLNDGNLNEITKDFDLVIVRDINDNPPEFQNLPYRWLIPENEPPSSNLSLTIEVVDRDQSSSGMLITYKDVSGSTAKNLFSLSDQTTSTYCNPSGSCVGRRFTRVLTILRALDYEVSSFYQLSVNATDLTDGGTTTVTDVIINVQDRQDTPPFFDGIPYLKNVPENSPSGTLVITLIARDGDRGVPNSISYHLDASNAFSKYFILNNVTGELRTSSVKLDREGADILAIFGTIDLPVIAKEMSSVVQPANISQAGTTVRITVDDENDFFPTFEYPVYNGSVPENTMAGVPVNLFSQISISDLDAGDNGVFNLTLMRNGQVYRDFEVSPVTISRQGAVFIMVKNSSLLDYETVQSVTFQIVATETRTTQRFSSMATVQLQILDVNDNRPVFNQSGYAFTIPENSPINTFVGRVKATDADSGAFGTVSYALDGTDAFKFRINSTTGDIFVNVDADKNLTLLDRERFSTIFLTIEGRDGGGFVTAVQMEILLSDQNDQAPVFTRLSYFGVVKENSFTFDSPVQVEAADNDLKGSNNSIVEYRIIGGDLGGNFNIVSTSGLLMIRTPLNYESLPSSIVNLTISAYDLGVPSLNSSINVQVTVLDQNDNSPICTYALFNATVMENATSGTQILQVNATDADPPGSENSRVFFRIQTGAADKFTIDGNTGWIVVERGADLDVTRYGSRYNLSIIVYDNGTPQRNGTCIAVIFVRDVNNQRPYFEVPTRRETVQENLSLNQPLPITPQFTAKDPDTTSNLQYSILFSQMSATEGNGQQVSVSNYNYTDLLYVSSTNGTLFVKNILDREKAQEIQIPIFVQDLAAETPLPVQTATGTLIITLSDLNDESPVFQLPAVNNTYRITVSEGLRPPTDISLKALATDPDTSNPPLVYSISPPSTIFSIDTNTAQVSLKTALDRETADQHQFFVLVNDSIHITTATVYVNVSDFNDVTPSFYQFASNLSISEATSVGSLLTRVLAYDNDTGLFGTVHYRILSGGGGKFALNDTSGELRLGQALDRDVPGGEEYSLLIEAFDNPGSADSLRTSRAMMISVLDVNDNPPRFAQDNFTITSLLESMDSNQLIREISATDADTGVNAQISFSLRAIPGQNSDALNLFFVTTKQSGSVFSAAIWTRKSLTRAVGWYNLTLLATDAGTPTMTGSTNLTFFIADVNDHSPVFVYPNQTQTVIQVNESTNASSTIGKPLLVAKAIDQDYGNNTIVRFDLTSSNGDNAAFNIDAVSGLLTVATNLNREVKSEYRFSIKAYDLGVPPLTTMVNIVVQVLDVDESPPVFGPDSRVQQLSVPENSVPSSLIPGLTISGVRVGSIAKASDPDVTDKSTPICYFMLDPVYYMFYLNKTSGDLYVLSALDREAAPQYNLHVIAVGASQCNSTAYEWKNATNHRVKRYLDTTPIAYNPNNATMALIVVNVGDVNDNPPVWKNSIYYGGVRVTDPPSTTVFNFAEFVTDADIGNNSLLTFGMTGPTPDNQKLRTQLASREILDSVFTLDNRTGVLKTGDKTYFQETMTGAVSFNVTASDSKYLATTMCTIYLLSLEQQLIVVMSGVPANATRIRDAFVSYLSNITGWRIVVDNIVTHKNDDGTADNSKTDMYIHAINLKDNSIVPAATVRDKVDLLWPEMVAIYKTFGVLQVKLASQPASSDSILEIMRIALIVVACSLAILLFFACVSLWSCRRMYRRKLKAATAVAFGTNGHSNAPRTPGTNMHTYEGSNPIWLEAYNMNQYDNKNFESSDKGDSIDSSQMEPADQQIEMRFDEVEKTMEFLNDNISESGSTNFRNSREMLSSAVDAGPDILAEPTPGPGDDGLAPVNLNGVPATSI